MGGPLKIFYNLYAFVVAYVHLNYNITAIYFWFLIIIRCNIYFALKRIFSRLFMFLSCWDLFGEFHDMFLFCFDWSVEWPIICKEYYCRFRCTWGSFMSQRKSNGPRTVHMETPQSTVTSSYRNRFPLTSTFTFLFARNIFSQLFIGPRISFLPSFGY